MFWFEFESRGFNLKFGKKEETEEKGRKCEFWGDL